MVYTREAAELFRSLHAFGTPAATTEEARPTVKYNFRGETPALPEGSLVLVTGVTGLIGGHIADKLLAAGYRVRGVSRSAPRGQWTVNHFQTLYGADSYQLVQVSDMHSASAYKEALEDVVGVVHAASDLSFSESFEEVVPPTLSHIRAILGAAQQSGTVKRFVYTSSSTALTEPNPGIRTKITVETWNEDSVRLAKSKQAERPGFSIYAASKVLGEKEVWKFMREEQPGFVTSCVLPNMNFGRTLTKDHNGSTSLLVDRIWDEKEVNENKPPALPQWFVDVEDTALLHLAALIDPLIHDERILAFAEPFNWTKVYEAWKQLAPERDWGSVKIEEGQDLMELPIERGAELLSRFEVDGASHGGWTSMKESLRRKLASDRTQGKKF